MVHRFSRTEMLIGREGLDMLAASKVAVFGIGGVGSFAAEALARSGVGALILVDYDDVCITNINRQIHATTSTVGRAKVEVMRERILDINPEARVTAVKMMYNSDSAGALLKKDYDYVIDAIDMVTAKLDLITICTSMGIPIISSTGAGNKLDPTLFKVADIMKPILVHYEGIKERIEERNVGVEGCILVESPTTQRISSGEELVEEESHDKGAGKNVPGSISFVPSAAGLILAAEAIKDLLTRERKK